MVVGRWGSGKGEVGWGRATIRHKVGLVAGRQVGRNRYTRQGAGKGPGYEIMCVQGQARMGWGQAVGQ